MKKITFLIVLILVNLTIVSCEYDSLSETDTVYKNPAATEGDDGDIENDPDE